MTVNDHPSGDAAEDLLVVMGACVHRFEQPCARRLTEPRHARHAAMRRHLEAEGGEW
jgi:hypothetical protein